MYSYYFQIRKGDNCKETLLRVADVFQYFFQNHDFGQGCFSHKTCSRGKKKGLLFCKDVFTFSGLYFFFLISPPCHFAIRKIQEKKAKCDETRKIMVSYTVLLGRRWEKLGFLLI